MVPMLIESANSAAGRWGAWMIAVSLDSALLLAVVGVAWLAVRGRVSPQVGCGLFLLIPLKLLIPFAVTVPGAWATWTPSGLVLSRAQATRGPQEVGPETAPPSRVIEARPVLIAERDKAAPRAQVVISRSLLSNSSGEIALVSARPVAEVPQLTRTAMFMLAWLGVVGLLLGRLLLSQLRFRAGLRHASPLDSADLGIDLGELLRRSGVSDSTRFAEHPGIAAPSVWGIVRPMVLLPCGIAESLNSEQLRWALLHELAHIGRRDLVVVVMQRFAAILHFFNPAVWIANRVIHRLREYACDDLAVAIGQTSAVESGEAFLRILRHAGDGNRGRGAALGILGLDSRAGCLLRIHRLLDEGRPIRTATSARSLCGLVLLGLVTLPNLRASGEADPPKLGAVEAPAKGTREFELKVVGPDGKPIPEAEVELWGQPRPAGDQVRRGTFIRADRFGIASKTDAEGRLKIEMPRVPERFNVSIKIPGYGPYFAGWSSDKHDGPIPAQFTAELDAAWSVGGIVVDPGGKPVVGAKLRPSIEFKKRPGDTRQFGSGAQVRTDASGKWHFDSVPASMGEVHVAIDHPSFMPLRRHLPRAEFDIKRGQEPPGKIVLDRGLTVTGKVTDESGKPIAGALVRTKFHNEVREAKTGGDGIYKLGGCEPRPARIVASAKGRATDMKELNVEPGMGPVDFAMKPGGTVRVRVLDHEGKPVPRARILLQEWHGRVSYFEFDHFTEYADKDGVWAWNEAPLDEFRADICQPGGMQLVSQPLIARAEEYVFRLSRPLDISGSVFDAETKAPIKEFRVVPGVRWNKESLHWKEDEGFSVSDGRYQLRQDRGEFAHLVRIEAEGYRASVSRDIKSDEGAVTLDFSLERGKGIVAKVVTPQNVSAKGAKIALGVAGSQIRIKNGDIDTISTSCAQETADDSGRFQFPAQDKDFQLIIVHPSGYAHIKSPAEWEGARIIRLVPWARVEGTFRVGPKPGSKVPLAIRTIGHDSYGPGAARITTHHVATTGPDGHFVFERVFPGRGNIGREITFMVDGGATEVTSSCRFRADFPGGQMTHVDLGGTGRAVVGRLLPREGFAGKVRWNFATIWGQPEGGNAGEAPLYITASVDRDGSFRIDDVPPGKYSLSVRFDRDEAGRLLDHRFEVPATKGDASVQPVDLGTLKLEK